MITLITGAPGCGKTLIVVDEFLKACQDENRTIVADGIPDLAIPHEPADTVDKWTEEVDDPSSQTGKKRVFTFPQGAMVVVDECQRVFRPRAAGKAVPHEVAAFETHRHQGLDFVLITQHPGLLDSNVRRLVGRHLHIRDLGFLGRWVYEFSEATEPDRYKSAMVKRKWSLPKKSFQAYKSSSLHIKPVRGFPTALKVLGVALVLMAGGIYYATDSIGKKINPQGVAKTGTGAGQTTQGPIIPAVLEFNPVEQTMPRHPNYPESAPIYDTLRTVKAMPQVVGCIQTPNNCTCVSQQGTKLEVTDSFCRSYVLNPPFNPYYEPPIERVAEKQKPPQSQPAPSVPLIGQSSPEMPPVQPSLST